MHAVLRDLKLAVRSLLKTPGYSATVILCLALGIGASTGIYSVVNAVMYNAVPFDDAEEIVAVFGQNRGAGQNPDIRWLISPESFESIRTSQRTMDAVSGQQGFVPFVLRGEDETKQVRGSRITEGFFATYRHDFILGRPLSDDEIRKDEPVAVISSGLWEREFDSRPDIIGEPVYLNDVERTIVGVISKFQEFPINDEVYVPYSIPRILPNNQHAGRLFFAGRKKPGITLEQVQADLESAAAFHHETYRNEGIVLQNFYIAEPMIDAAVSFVQGGMQVVIAAVAFLLAITILNVVNLLLVRLQARQRQLAVMTALGASSITIFRQIISEIFMLAAPAFMLGVMATHYSLPALFSLNPLLAPDPTRISVDEGVLLFSIGLTTAVVFLIAVLGAWRASRIDMFDAIKEGGGKGSAGPKLQRALSSLVIAEISAAVLLVVGAGLMVRTYQELVDVDPGFEPRNVLTFNIGIPPSHAETHESRTRFVNELVSEIREMPGVVNVGAANALPVGGGGRSLRHSIQGKVMPNPTDIHLSVMRLVTFGYLEAMDIEVLEGRSFTAQDRIGSDYAVIVSKNWAETHFPGENVIGKRLKRGSYDSPWPWRTIIGVAEDVTDQLGQNGPTVRNGIGPSIYLPNDQYANANTFQMFFTVRTSNDPLALVGIIREHVLTKDRDTLFNNVNSMEQVMQNSLGQERFVLYLFTIFAGIGLVLAAAGIYGVIAYAVSQKGREFGIRLAIGASPASMVQLVLRRGLQLAGLGLVTGMAVAWSTSSALNSMLYGVSPTDPLIYLGVGVFLLIVTLAAAGIPAWRVTRIDPASALREE